MRLGRAIRESEAFLRIRLARSTSRHWLVVMIHINLFIQNNFSEATKARLSFLSGQ